jgi:hypothetical protein
MPNSSLGIVRSIKQGLVPDLFSLAVTGVILQLVMFAFANVEIDFDSGHSERGRDKRSFKLPVLRRRIRPATEIRVPKQAERDRGLIEVDPQKPRRAYQTY